jgi:hypothetical protein
MKILCWVGVHRWQVSRIEKIRYGVIRTLLCRRSGTSHRQAVW